MLKRNEGYAIGGKGHKIDLSALAGIALLTALLVGVLWLPHGKASRRGLADSAQRAHDPMHAVEPVTHRALGRPKASTVPGEKSDPTGAPAELPDRNTLVLNRSVTSRHLEMLHPHFHTDGKTQRPSVATASPKTHRGGLYTVLLLLLANSRH